MSALLAVTVILPFAFAILALGLGGSARLRPALCVAYSLAFTGLNLVLLNGFLAEGGLAWGSLRVDRLNFPVFLVLNLLAAAVILYAGFESSGADGFARGFLIASMFAGSGFASLLVLARGLLAFAVLWEAVTLAALAGLLVAGRGMMRRRLVAFLPWLVSDVLFLSGAILSKVLLAESAVLIEPPLTAGSEAGVTVVMLLFLASVLLRLSVFPFSFWVADLADRADPAWSAMFLGAVNFLVAGFRLLVVAALIARLAAADWSVLLALLGAFSVVAGPVYALRSRRLGQYVSGMYAFEAGFLLAGVALYEGRHRVRHVLAARRTLAITAMLFACGTVSYLKGGSELGQNQLSPRAARAAFAALLLSGVSIAGLPPMSGFVARALTALAGIERAFVAPLYALLAAAGLAGAAVVVAALARVMSRLFAATGEPLTGRRPAVATGLAALAACGASLLLGLFPGILLRNFIAGGSRLLFRTGFEGPGVVFRGSGTAIARAFSLYTTWSETAAAFLFVVLVLAAAAYFMVDAKRQARPDAGTMPDITCE